MEHFLDPEVIAGIILAFYFFARAATGLFDRRNGNGNGKAKTVADPLTVVHDCPVMTAIDLENLKRDVKCIKTRVEAWNDQIKAGDFTCKWTDRETYEVLEILKRIERNLL